MRLPHPRACNSRLLIGSPFVNDGILQLTDLVTKEASRTLVTRTDLRDFAMGASSLDTLCFLSKDGVSIRSLHGLHAKMYAFNYTGGWIIEACTVAYSLSGPSSVWIRGYGEFHHGITNTDLWQKAKFIGWWDDRWQYSCRNSGNNPPGTYWGL